MFQITNNSYRINRLAGKVVGQYFCSGFSESFRVGRLFNALILMVTLSGTVYCAHSAEMEDMYSGHYAREGNVDSPGSAIDNNIYIKFFKDQWIAMLYVPMPYAKTVPDAAITRAFEQAKSESSTSSYVRGQFGQFTESATVHIEKYGHLEDRLVFECGSLAPCTIRLSEGYLELIKPGVINEHIIRYNHVTGH